MFPLTRTQFLKFAAAGTLVALSAVSTLAFYVPGSGRCDVNAVVWNGDDTDANTAVRVRVSLNPGQTVQIDTAENKSLPLRCGDYAEALDTVAEVASK
jgi:hypothetical protein